MMLGVCFTPGFLFIKITGYGLFGGSYKRMSESEAKPGKLISRSTSFTSSLKSDRTFINLDPFQRLFFRRFLLVSNKLAHARRKGFEDAALYASAVG